MVSKYQRIDPDAVPWLTVEQMVEADRLAIDTFGITLLQMMEHAGTNLADVVDHLSPEGPLSVLAGGGNNGGGGLCAARHLANRGREVTVVLVSDRLGPAARRHLSTLAEMGIDPVESPNRAGSIVDAMVGYGLTAGLRGRAAQLAKVTGDRFTVSLDMPSGLGGDGAVRADATMTLALPKQRLRDHRRLFLADLGLPDELWKRLELPVGSLFAAGPILEIVP